MLEVMISVPCDKLSIISFVALQSLLHTSERCSRSFSKEREVHAMARQIVALQQINKKQPSSHSHLVEDRGLAPLAW
jgi:hypothetical protein